MAERPGLERFRLAQDADCTWERALGELRAGRKSSHWMWFVFPQIAGLGHSELSRRYAIASRAEAREYLADEVLGPRLREAAAALLAHEETDPARILGAVDALKLRSSMTLFLEADPSEAVFVEVLERFYGGLGDEATLRLLGAG